MQLTDLSIGGALDMLERIRNTLWPVGDEGRDWSPDTTQAIADVFVDYGLDREPQEVTEHPAPYCAPDKTQDPPGEGENHRMWRAPRVYPTE